MWVNFRWRTLLSSSVCIVKDMRIYLWFCCIASQESTSSRNWRNQTYLANVALSRLRRRTKGDASALVGMLVSSMGSCVALGAQCDLIRTAHYWGGILITPSTQYSHLDHLLLRWLPRPIEPPHKRALKLKRKTVASVQKQTAQTPPINDRVSCLLHTNFSAVGLQIL